MLATCDGLRGAVATVASGDGEHCAMFRSDKVSDGTSCGAKSRQRHAVSPVAGANCPTVLNRALYKFFENCTIAGIFCSLLFFSHSFAFLPRFSGRHNQHLTQLKGGCMAVLPTSTRPICVLGTPACPQCKDTALEPNGGFLTCAKCGLAITRQALLQESLSLASSVESQ